jgi:hypothetical protein
MTGARIFTWQSSSSDDSAVFYLYGQDRFFLVLIPEESGTKDDLTCVFDEVLNSGLVEVVWSNDESVLALRRYGDPMFTHAYDFEAKQTVEVADSGSDNKAEIRRKHSERISEL